MSAPGQLPDADDLRAAADLTRQQRELELRALAAEAEAALTILDPMLALLPEPVRTVATLLRRLAALAS